MADIRNSANEKGYEEGYNRGFEDGGRMGYEKGFAAGRMLAHWLFAGIALGMLAGYIILSIPI